MVMRKSATAITIAKNPKRGKVKKPTKASIPGKKMINIGQAEETMFCKKIK
jgi:hypothetical protein